MIDSSRGSVVRGGLDLIDKARPDQHDTTSKRDERREDSGAVVSRAHDLYLDTPKEPIAAASLLATPDHGSQTPNPSPAEIAAPIVVPFVVLIRFTQERSRECLLTMNAQAGGLMVHQNLFEGATQSE